MTFVDPEDYDDPTLYSFHVMHRRAELPPPNCLTESEFDAWYGSNVTTVHEYDVAVVGRKDLSKGYVKGNIMWQKYGDMRKAEVERARRLNLATQ